METGIIIAIVTEVILATWYAATACRAVAVYRIARAGRMRRYWVAACYLSACVVHSIIRLYLVHGYPQTTVQHRAFIAHSAPVLLALMGAAIIAAYRAVTESYPNWRVAGTVFLATLAGVGTGASLLLKDIGVPAGWSGMVNGAILLERNTLIAMAIVLSGVGYLITKLKDLPVRPSAQAAATLLCVEVAFGIVAAAFSVATNHRFMALEALMPVLGGLVVGALWAFRFPLTSDECAEVEVPQPGEYENVTHQQQLLWSVLPELRRALRRG